MIVSCADPRLDDGDVIFSWLTHYSIGPRVCKEKIVRDGTQPDLRCIVVRLVNNGEIDTTHPDQQISFLH